METVSSYGKDHVNLHLQYRGKVETAFGRVKTAVELATSRQVRMAPATDTGASLQIQPLGMIFSMHYC